MALVSLDGKAPAKHNIQSEREFREALLEKARTLGCEIELLMIFDKYDKLMRNCKNENERKDIGKLGAIEVYKLLDNYGPLSVDGQVIVQ